MQVSKKASARDLELVCAFINTREVETGADELSTPEALADWLAGRGLVPKGARGSGVDFERAIELREALRGELLRNNSAEASFSGQAVLNAVAAAAGLIVRFRQASAVVEPTSQGVLAALGRLLAIVAQSMAEGTWARVKACREGTCLWAFYDGSRNRSRTWCSMAVCGNRTKVRSYRKRAKRT
jgi:predicted RNA-binding Zn ribbon-like protein